MSDKHPLSDDVVGWCDRNNISRRANRHLVRGLYMHWPKGTIVRKRERSRSYDGSNYYNYLRLVAFGEILVSEIGNNSKMEISRALKNENRTLPAKLISPDFITLTVTVPIEFSKSVIDFVEQINNRSNVNNDK